jgi:hypothetical protein
MKKEDLKNLSRPRNLIKKPGKSLVEKDLENLMRLRTLREKRKTWRIF